MQLIWEFIESDFITFAIPNTAFGIFSALAAPVLVETSTKFTPSAKMLVQRVPFVLGYNVANLLVFNLANQRATQSVTEDRINKPWRPIPQGKINTDQTRRMMLVVIPVTLAMNYALNVWHQGVLIHILSWLYNDLQGGDELFIREIIIAVAYGLFNGGSLAVAIGQESSLNSLGFTWIIITSGVILTTMQIQDLKDQEGDKSRDRKTIAIVFGEQFSRMSTALFVCVWTLLCSYFWAVGPVAFTFIASPGSVVILRLFLCSSHNHARTWRWWCFWHASLYMLPTFVVLGNFQ
ncbi:hypothetical protein QQS21_011201 [Conoideocrella luteorostrata]|uniref:UbiA prenyltransferase n=1 Tax=Conoideocrella luteorostrata TaxID=1105319 RepID=A0AAJ0CDJ1_9HYPO|nr:hypothetical protein QQS21_011201 [Conoideocrella luteorostrata]